MKESYMQQPKEIELFQMPGLTDVIIRRNIVAVDEVDDEGVSITRWDCDETQFRYPGILSIEEVEANLDKWIRYADPSGASNLESAKDSVINRMSSTCNSAIRAGFDVVLSDGEAHHFSLEITDQIMISLLAGKAAAGQSVVPWHADGEGCKFFSAADITAINKKMEALITYHQTYFNNLKQYILVMESEDEVNSAWYGMPIPEEYQTEVMRSIIEAEDDDKAAE